jgi:hypothetical protein
MQASVLPSPSNRSTPLITPKVCPSRWESQRLGHFLDTLAVLSTLRLNRSQDGKAQLPEKTEREGFEPSVGGEPYTGLAILRLRPCSATSPSQVNAFFFHITRALTTCARNPWHTAPCSRSPTRHIRTDCCRHRPGTIAPFASTRGAALSMRTFDGAVDARMRVSRILSPPTAASTEVNE